METMYIFGGYILTGGTLQDGNPWKGVNILLAECKPSKNGGYNLPVVGFVAKASRLDHILDVCQNTTPGTYVHAYFSAPDHNGKVKLVKLEVVD